MWVKSLNGHKVIVGSTPEKQKDIATLMQHWNDQQPIAWKKIHDVPDFVYFSHKRHIQAGFDCMECHGDISLLDVVSMDTMQSDLSMGWCVNCHRDVNENGINGMPAHASLDCDACHH